MLNNHLAYLRLQIRKLDSFGGFSESSELCLIPLVPQIVISVDIDAKRIILDPPKGLLELTYFEKVKYVIRGFLPERALHLTESDRRELRLNTIFVEDKNGVTLQLASIRSH